MKRHRRNSGKLPRARSFAAGQLFALLTVFLVACSSVSELPGINQLAAGDGPAYLLTVDLAKGDTEAEILDRHGGEIVVWVEGEFAVVGLAADEVAQQGGDFSLLGTGGGPEANLQLSTEPNAIRMHGTSGLWAGGTSFLWAGGTSSLWAGGTSYLWAGGTSYLWAGGEFLWMPENTAIWQQIRLEEAHGMVWESLGEGISVAVIDTGVDLEHPALSEALEQGIDFVDNDLDPQEQGTEADSGFGHGTNVAGIVRQVAPRATIIPIRILRPDGTGNADDLVEAIVWAVDEAGADVINLSLGGAQHIDAVDVALRYAASKGVYVVASAGDSGTSDVTYPASEAYLGAKAPYMLSLTSVDLDDVKSDFAPYHPVEVEMSAPGEYVYGPAPGLRAAAWSGTSMSAPMASGALALALGAERAGDDLAVDGERLTEVLRASSDRINRNNRSYAGRLGTGRLDVANYLSTVLGTGSGWSSDEYVDEDEDQGSPSRGGDDSDEAADDPGRPSRASGGNADQGRGRPSDLPEAASQNGATQNGARGNRGN